MIKNEHKILTAQLGEVMTGEDLLKPITGIAYSGGVMGQPYGNVVVDLAGVSFAPQVPLMYNHYNEPEYRLGEVVCRIEDGKIVIDGAIDQTFNRGRNIVEAGKHIKWQLSIGASGEEVEYLPEEAEAVVNGNVVKGELFIYRKCIIREVSVVAIGADAETEMRIAASFNLNPIPVVENQKKENEMEETQKLTASEAEVERIAQLRAMLTDDKPKAMQDYITASIGDGSQVEDVKRTLNLMSKMIDNVPNIATSKVEKPQMNDNKILSAALMQSAGVNEATIIKKVGEQTLEAAQEYRGLGLKDAIIRAARGQGIDILSYSGDKLVQAAYNTSGLSGLFGDVINAVLVDSFRQQEQGWREYCKVGTLSDFKKTNYYRVDGFGALKEVANGGEIKAVNLKEATATNQLKTYAGNFKVTRQDIINDNLGALRDLPAKFGRGAGLTVAQVVTNVLESNPTVGGQRFFSSAHHNNFTGSTSALSADALNAARVAFRRQLDANGNVINNRPAFIVVPPELEATAINLTQSLELTGAQSLQGNLNVISQYGLKVNVNPFLSSQTGWYLIGDPRDVPAIQVDFLNGNEVPMVSEAYSTVDVDGYGWKCVFDFGVAPMAYQSATYSAGA